MSTDYYSCQLVTMVTIIIVQSYLVLFLYCCTLHYIKMSLMSSVNGLIANNYYSNSNGVLSVVNVFLSLLIIASVILVI